MKNFYETMDTELLEVVIELGSISKFGAPWATVALNNKQVYNTYVADRAIVRQKVDLLEPIDIAITLSKKIYNEHAETALLINSIKIDGIELMPDSCHLANYENDQQNNSPTTYLGFNGTWKFSTDRPFYQWLHQTTGQGWLLEPM